MYDSCNRKINYLRISVTDRCNLRCSYCMPAEGIPLLRHTDILSYDEIVDIVKHGAKNGIDKVRITGGEPLVRKNMVELVRMIAAIDEIRDLSMTTNGVLLPKYAKHLKEAGLQRVNISLDTLDEQKFSEITRLGQIETVFAGIEAAQKAGLTPVKINCVIQKSKLEPDAQAINRFCEENELEIRYIRQMNLEKGQFWQVQGGEGGHCATCNRLRLTANGKLKPCLFSDLEYDVRKLGIEKAYNLALTNKPARGTLSNINKFSNIGG